jgi:trimethylamine--corrinoid protein Co-methyltransferase
MPSPLRFLTADALRRVHGAALCILERTGMQVDHEGALELLAAAGASVDRQAGRVRFPAELVEACLARVPRTLTYHGRTPDADVTVTADGGLTARVPGGATNYIDLETGANRRASIADWREFARLADALPNIGLIATLHCGDVPAATADLHSVRALLASTRKCLVHNAFSAGNQLAIYEMLVAVAGSREALAARPFLHQQASVISPLFLNRDDVEQILVACEHGIPLDLPLMSIAGISSPITLAGTLAQTTAEYLGTVVLAQTARPGHPMAFFVDPVTGDMRTGAALFGAPETGLLVAAICQLGTELYGLPAQAIGLDSDGFSAGQTMLQKAQMLALQVLAGGRHVVGAGSVESCMALSPLQLVIDDELMAIARRWIRGIVVDEDRLAVDAIDRVGPRGSFLMDDHTLDHLRDGELVELPLAERGSRQSWEAGSRRTMESKARDRARSLLSTHEPPAMPDDVARELEAILARADRVGTGGAGPASR